MIQMKIKLVIILGLIIGAIVGTNLYLTNAHTELENKLEYQIEVSKEQQQKIKDLNDDLYVVKTRESNEASRGAISRELRLPDNFSSVKKYMDYRCLTDHDSEQWKLQEEAYTDYRGFRKIDNDYMIALGSYYVDKIGNRFIIELEDGTGITAIAGDVKSDRHTDSYNMTENGNLLEFIVDEDRLPKQVRLMGDVSFAGLKGKIKSIRRIE